jgi:hypothetical protein
MKGSRQKKKKNRISAMKIFLLKRRWLFCCLLFLSFSCKSKPAYKNMVMTAADSVAQKQLIKKAFLDIEKVRPYIKNGDLITRTGNDFTSESLRSLNQRDKTYSHCGIASIENDSLFVYHALGGEWNPDQKIRRDPLFVFAEPYSNRGIGLYRFVLQPQTFVSLLDTVRSYHAKGVMFDMDFDLKTDDHMYCAEFVAKCFTNGSNGSITFPHSFISKFEFIGVDDIFLHSSCQKIDQLVYK